MGTYLGYERHPAAAPRAGRAGFPRQACRSGYALWVDAIDWGAAQRIGELVAGSPPYGGVRASSVEPLAHDFARRVGAYSGLQVPAALPALEAVDRPGWIAAR
jgi:hypothetical protein